jgi:clan AA aspartic protease
MTMFPMVDVDVGGTRGQAKVRALLDTGFDGYVCLPTETAVRLGLDPTGSTMVEYADGRQQKELRFKGKVRFKGKTKTVEIYLTDSDEALVGMKLLRGCRVLIDVPDKKVRITRTKTKKSDESKGEK